jgi:hypothetical protein
MRLPAVTRGPVTLYQIEYDPKRSQQTFAFSATLEISGYNTQVENDGGGSPSIIRSRQLTDTLERYAATLPPLSGLPVTADTLISLMVGEALEQHESKQAERAHTARTVRP